MLRDEFVTTAAKIEGFRITKLLGVVYGDAIHKPNFTAMTSARDFGVVGAMAYGSAKMNRTENLVKDARDYAYMEMKESAERLGANAIVGYVSNSSLGNDLMHISVYGTAVKIVSDADYSKQREAEAEAKAREEAEQAKRDAELKRKFEELRSRRGSKEYWREESFLESNKDVDSVMKIWQAWSALGLGNTYPDIDREIRTQKDSERMYGKMPGEAKRLIEKISKEVFGE